MILLDANTAESVPHWVNLLMSGGGGAATAVLALFLSGKIVLRADLNEAIRREDRALKERDEYRDISDRAVKAAQDANQIAQESMGLLRRISGYIEGGAGGTDLAARRDSGAHR